MPPRKSEAQIIGDKGERLVIDIIDNHRDWLARKQDQDFGIDLEAEFSPHVNSHKEPSGKLVKIQVKANKKVSIKSSCIKVKIKTDWINYSAQFKLPVIIAVACISSGEVWWVWAQEWLLLNEQVFYKKKKQTYITISIPKEQTLRSALTKSLVDIALGSTQHSMILSLRDLINNATGWEYKDLSRALIEQISKYHFPSQEWTIQKATDILLGFGKNPLFHQAQSVLPMLLNITEFFGNSLSRDQLYRLVAREETFSRTGIIALGNYYDFWPDEAKALNLPKMFWDKGLKQVAWYTAMRERFPDQKKTFCLWIINQKPTDLNYKNISLDLTSDTSDYIMRKWPTRGDTILLDCLTITQQSTRMDG